MTNYQRITAKVFGETASATGDEPEIAQFGSALAGTYVGTTDVETIQNLTAWSNGYIDCVTPDYQFPPLPEMTGVNKVITYQEAYLLQKGIPEWDSGTTYYANDFCRVGKDLYYSLQDNNTNNNPTNDNINWTKFRTENDDWCITSPTTTPTATLNKPAVMIDNYKNGTDGYVVFSDGLTYQWGQIPYNVPASTAPINLKITMADTDYMVFNNRIQGSGNNVRFAKTTTTITPQEPYGGDWLLVGYKAMS